MNPDESRDFPQGDSDDEQMMAQFLRQLLGDQAGAEALRAMQASGMDASAFASQFGSPAQMQAALGQFRYLMNASTGPVNWSMAADVAKQKAYQSGDPSPTAAQAGRARDALTVADLWLDTVTDLAPGVVQRAVWSRVQWVEGTLEVWKRICEPVATNVSRALIDAMQAQAGEAEFAPPEVAALLGQTQQMMPRLASMLFAAQVGEALAELAKDSFGSTDVGLPMAARGVTALVTTNVDTFAEGLDIPFEEVLQFVAVRECAHQRLFTSVPWLAGDLVRAVEKYSAHIAIDTEQIAAAAASVDPSDPASMERALSGGVFAAEPTQKQREALERLETLLALVEGWVEVVTARAVAPYLPHADQLREMLRRRRAGGVPAEQVLGRLIGLQMRPRRARGAAELFSIVEAESGAAERDALWDHPDMIPGPADLDSPSTFLVMRQAAAEQDAEIDAALEALLDGTMGYAEGLEPGVDPNVDGGPADGSAE